ncbi:MAG: hypothetical protein N6V49_12820, partial [Serratia symbiotica]|nr:hypothetical protein [Serratia symbiotica]
MSPRGSITNSVPTNFALKITPSPSNCLNLFSLLLLLLLLLLFLPSALAALPPPVDGVTDLPTEATCFGGVDM